MKRKGFRNYVNLKSFNPIKLRVGLGLFALAVGILTLNTTMTLLALLMPVGFEASRVLGIKVKLNKDGLSGDNLKLYEDLERRFEALPDSPGKEVIAEQVREALKDYMDLDKEKLKEMLSEGDKGVRSILVKQGEAIKNMQEAIEKGFQSEDYSVRGQVAAWQKRNREALDKIKSGEKTSLEPLELRVVASPMTPSNTLNGSAYLPRPEFESGVNDIVRVAPTFWDYIRKGRTGSAVYVWVNKKNPQGAAGFIAPGVAKPGISFELDTEVSNAKKIAASLKTATELLQDIEGMASFIEDELRYAVDHETNVKLMTGAVSSTVPAGIQTLSVAYSLVGVETQDANNWDALIAIEAQLRAGNLYGPVVHFVNPIDYANMRLTKAVSQGQLFIPTQSGGVVVEDNNVPVGYVQSALINYYKVLIYKDMTITMGWENDDFTKNLVTFIGERRLHQFFSENFTGAFIYDTFANIKAAIEQA